MKKKNNNPHIKTSYLESTMNITKPKKARRKNPKAQAKAPPTAVLIIRKRKGLAPMNPNLKKAKKSTKNITVSIIPASIKRKAQGKILKNISLETLQEAGPQVDIMKDNC